MKIDEVDTIKLFKTSRAYREEEGIVLGKDIIFGDYSLILTKHEAEFMGIEYKPMRVLKETKDYLLLDNRKETYNE